MNTQFKCLIVASFVVLGSFLFTSRAFSQSIEVKNLEGLYQVQMITVPRLIEVELVSKQNEKRMNELKTLGHLCFLEVQVYRCTKTLKNPESDQIPAETFREVVSETNGSQLEFQKSGMLPELVQEGESLAEYLISDRVNVTNRGRQLTLNGYRYLIVDKVQNPIHKIALNIRNFDHWFVINGQGLLEWTIVKNVKVSETRSQNIYFTVFYNRL